MAELMDTLEQLLEQRTGQISSRIGADEAKTRSALHAAVPALLAAFSQEAARGGGIRQAIERDHDGTIIDQLSEYLGGSAQLSPRTTNGAGILDHVLGDRRTDMQQALSAKSGLDAGSIGSLLALLAPIVMGMIGKKSNASQGAGSASTTWAASSAVSARMRRPRTPTSATSSTASPDPAVPAGRAGPAVGWAASSTACWVASAIADDRPTGGSVR